MLAINEKKNVSPEDKNFASRDKRAQGIAAMGLVTREGDRFQVATPSLRGRGTTYEVRRDDAGRVRCSCLEFEEKSSEGASYRCEHILAVKYSLRARTSEAVTKQQTVSSASPVAAHTEAKTPTQTPNTQTQNASEKRETETRFEREQNETRENTNSDAVRSLAKHENKKEHEMKTQKFNEVNSKNTNGTSFAFEAENDFNETPQTEARETVHSNAPNIVPFAFVNTLKQLRQPIDPKLVKTREGWIDRQGNRHMVEYVEWHTVADLLDRLVPTWSHSVRDIKQIGETVAVTAAIMIDGVTREGIGTGRADTETGIKKAEHDALKRAAIKFGIARELYQRESEVIESDGAAISAKNNSREFPSDPIAKSLADLVTPKQLGMIRALGREAGIDTEEACQALLDCHTDELSKRAASNFIEHLQEMSREAASVNVRRAS